ncbi:hypothetical protein AC792_13640 [Arthrobacter sp. RIT-PI-e]|uniref:hypothetical protein n=1 Tax=Arthrobacter sp. RIT-PI-e TaxID=1681197 RepID=UPI000676A44B|nr:hypothetical protein [Arthrobacter sp. RIT-PI-e]KNC17875.1 hypothetical protein AC792_13640 [Arthrobacter sp. RIT-PI-e]
MYPRLRTLIKVDLTHRTAVLQVTGHLTTINYRALIPIIRRAHALPGNPSITIDTTQARFLDPAAIGLLKDACRKLSSPTPSHTVPVQVIGALRSAEPHPAAVGQDIMQPVHLTPPDSPVGTTTAYTLAS